MSKDINTARKTGDGINFPFKEQMNYMPSKDLLKDGYKCPHCKKYDINAKNVVLDRYEIPDDVEYMNNYCEGNHWTEDIKCGLCGQVYSFSNGC